MSFSRRQFCIRMAGASGALEAALAGAPAEAQKPATPAAPSATGSHIGSLYPFVQQQANRSPLELSWLRAEFKDLRAWQQRARAKAFEHLFYGPAAVSADPELVRRTDKGDYFEEYLTFRTTPDSRVPAYVLVPKNTGGPAPGIVALHDHGGFYLWGKEKLIETPSASPSTSSVCIATSIFPIWRP